MIGSPKTREEPTETPPWDLPVRMLGATGLVLLITSIANVIGPGLSGLAATFPLLAMVLAVFAHQRQGTSAAQSVFRGLVLGLADLERVAVRRLSASHRPAHRGRSPRLSVDDARVLVHQVRRLAQAAGEKRVCKRRLPMKSSSTGSTVNIGTCFFRCCSLLFIVNTGAFGLTP